jgi:hypothetical protein
MKKVIGFLFVVALGFNAVDSRAAADAANKGWNGNYLSLFGDLNSPKYKELFATLLSSKVPNEKAAADRAWAFCLKMHTAPSAVFGVPIGLYRASGGYGDLKFASPGDWIWVVVLSKFVTLDGVVLVNARTGNARLLDATQ